MLKNALTQQNNFLSNTAFEEFEGPIATSIPGWQFVPQTRQKWISMLEKSMLEKRQDQPQNFYHLAKLQTIDYLSY